MPLRRLRRKEVRQTDRLAVKMTKVRNKARVLDAATGEVDAARTEYRTTLMELQRSKGAVKRMRLKAKAKKQRKKIEKKMKQEVKASVRYAKKSKKAEKAADKLLETQRKIQARTP